MTPTDDQRAAFERDGFLVVERLVDPGRASRVAERYERIFGGFFETTVPPDEWRWTFGRDPDDVTRQIWNAWKSDRVIAELALDEVLGQWCAALMGWSGTRLNQDGCLWKPPGARGLAFHQDGNYNGWVDPLSLVTCWVALDDADAASGSIVYARGSHRWGAGERPETFHAPDDPEEKAREHAERIGEKLDLVTVEIPRGGCAFHHTWLWHGSRGNDSDRDLRALALHCMPAASRFHPTNPAFAQGRFKRFGSTEMAESFYPILWSGDGRRSRFIDDHVRQTGRAGYQTHTWRE